MRLDGSHVIHHQSVVRTVKCRHLAALALSGWLKKVGLAGSNAHGPF